MAEEEAPEVEEDGHTFYHFRRFYAPTGEPRTRRKENAQPFSHMEACNAIPSVTGDQLIMVAIHIGHIQRSTILGAIKGIAPDRKLASYMGQYHANKHGKWTVSDDGVYALTTTGRTLLLEDVKDASFKSMVDSMQMLANKDQTAAGTGEPQTTTEDNSDTQHSEGQITVYDPGLSIYSSPYEGCIEALKTLTTQGGPMQQVELAIRAHNTAVEDRQWIDEQFAKLYDSSRRPTELMEEIKSHSKRKRGAVELNPSDLSKLMTVKLRMEQACSILQSICNDQKASVSE